MEETTLKRVANIRKWIVRLGALRDGLLVAGAVLYGFGYVAFSLFAWIHHLGPVPGIEAQYFIAGIPALLVVALGVAIALAFHRFHAVTWPAWYATATVRTKWAISVVVTSTLIASTIYSNKYPIRWEEQLSFRWWDIIILIGTVFLLPLLRLPTRKPHFIDMIFQKLMTLFTGAYIVGFGIMAALFYLKSVYPRIPQALGGGAPRTAILSLNTDTLPPPIVQMLTGKATQKNEKLAESIRLLVFVDTKETLVVAIRERQVRKPWDLFEISRSSITSVRWVE
jgi:hypothetical protein